MIVCVPTVMGGNDASLCIDQEISRQAQDSVFGSPVEPTGGQDPAHAAVEDTGVQQRAQ
jgi:hypothetical protein